MFERYSKDVLAEYLRAFVFGVEDSVASTVGLLSGIAIAGVARETILLTGAILILVERAKEGSLNAVPIAKDVFNWYYENRLKN